MARIRTIKPEFWHSTTLARLDRDTRMLFIGLWNYADDEGRAKAHPLIIKGVIFPLDEDLTADVIAGMLEDLAAVGVIVLYEVDGESYLEITGWSEHQVVNRPTPSKLPGQPPDTDPSCDPPGTLMDGSVSVHGGLTLGREGKGREGNRETTRASDDAQQKAKPIRKTFPDDFAEFWELSPRRVSKKAAAKRYDVVRRDGTSREQILEGLALYKKREWKGRETQHVPHASTWLNQFDPSELDQPALRSVPDGPTHECWAAPGHAVCVICNKPMEAA